MTPTLRAPFPYFGGKSRIAALVWERLGDVVNYVEPFFGSGAVLLARPHPPHTETVNDADAHLANFWRAVRADPEGVARWADWPVNEVDLEARHHWLVNAGAERVERLRTDPDYYDTQCAGWWVWGISQWIGGGWCSGKGPWRLPDGGGRGIKREMPHLGNTGVGVHRQMPHLGNAGRGVHRQRPHLGNTGVGVHQTVTIRDRTTWLIAWMTALSDRLRAVRVCCGDWFRVCGPTPTHRLGLTGVFLDPPYSHAERDNNLYATEMTTADDVRAWAIANGDNPLMRIALCGYDGEHAMPDGWERVTWKAHGGYGNQADNRGRENAARETVWFSPHCLRPDRARQLDLELLA